uniref:Uncharacterized protein n=1 Tax=Caenorhabditis tropicalis TaxID=1561998 RepID=A0A1I7UZY5_9PELO
METVEVDLVTSKSSETNNNRRRQPKKQKRKKQIVLDKDRKIIQKEKELYQVVFDAEGFSVHDLALLGQKNSPDTLIRERVRPKKMGRVDIYNDFPINRPSKTPSKSAKSTKAAESPSSKGEFEIAEILDYVDDLYLQLMDPDRTVLDDRNQSTSTTDNASSK